MKFRCCLVFMFLGFVGGKVRAGEKLNVLFICVDDLKPIAGCYGGTAKTPNLDRLAKRGVRFERAYCNEAVCAPSRNSLLTGVRPQSLGIYDLGTNFREARPDAVTLPQAFLRAGYRTEALGKIFHVGHGNHEDPASWSVPHWKSEVIAYRLPENRVKGGTREEALFENRPADKLPRGAAFEAGEVDDSVYPDGAMAEEAVRRLQAAAKRGEPFFIALGFVKPHLPFCAPKKYWDLYDPKAFALPERRTAPEGAPGYAPTTWGELRQYRDMPEKGALSDAEARQMIHGYHAATSYMDAQLGKVLDALDASGVAEKTIVVLWGDHGWHLGDHGQWCKHTNYEEAAHIPLLVIAPGVKPAVSPAMVETVDIFPTLCELAGVAAPAELEGASFAGVLRGEAGKKAHIFHVFPRGDKIGRAVRTERFRLVEWKVPGAAEATAELELYDYQADPVETKNLAASEPEVVKRLLGMLYEQAEAKPQIQGAREKQDREKMFAKRDKDGDGKLTREEFLANQPDPDKAPARFLKFDANGDGVLSRGEFVKMGAVK